MLSKATALSSQPVSVDSIGIENLIPGLPIKASASSQLYSTKLVLDDLFEGNSVVINPHPSTLQVQDLELKYDTAPVLLSGYVATNNMNIDDLKLKILLCKRI